VTDEHQQNQGLQEAHTPPEISAERAAKIGSTAALAETAMADLAQSLAGGQAEAEQQSLLLDEMDEQQCLFAGPVAHVASTISDARRARGRPKGSQNKASREFAQTLMRMGYRHPGLNLAALANADPKQLAQELSVNETDKNGVVWRTGCTPADAMAMILKANAELLPYFESKQATKIEATEQLLGVMVIGTMPSTPPEAGAVLNLTRVDAPEKDQ
jgi:hypothetical protein